MIVRWKGPHPEGGMITSLDVTAEEAKKLAIPSDWRNGLWLREDHPALAKDLNVKTRWFCLKVVDA